MRILLPAAASIMLAVPACSRGDVQTPAPEPAKVTGHAVETDLATVSLTPEAEKRLGIETAAIVRRDVPITRILGGEVVSSAGEASLQAGYSAAASMDISALAVAQIESDNAVARAGAAVEAARLRYNRARSLVAEEAESAQTRDDALAALRGAQADVTAARSRRGLLGQSIAAGAPADRLWVRASVYTGDLGTLDRSAAATVRKLGASGLSRQAAPLAGPSAASARTGVSFLVYELDNKDGAFVMGERVTVVTPRKGSRNALTAPWSAILYDVNGGEWVYERISDHVYARRRVEVIAVTDDLAILARGPKEGTPVVAVGGPELFGTEFGAGH